MRTLAAASILVLGAFGCRNLDYEGWCPSHPDDSICRDAASDDVGLDSGGDVVEEASDAPVADGDAATCTPGEFTCGGTTGGELKKCGTDGKSLEAIASCPSAATCSPTLKRCTACSPGEYSCSGAALVKCDPLGLPSITADTCATAELCAASTSGTGTCTAPACALGEKKCTAKTASVCNVGRTGFVDEACAIGCASGACIKVVELSSNAGQHTCALLSDDSVRCWGDEFAGATGDGPTPHNKPTKVSGLTAVLQVTTGVYSSAARLVDGTAKWWGQLPAITYTVTKTPTAVTGVSKMTDLALGLAHICVIDDGAVKCFGKGSSGQLGDGTGIDRGAPTTLTALSSPLKVVVTRDSSFVVQSTDVRGWGANGTGQLGDGTTTTALSPVLVFGSATQVSTSGFHSCVRTSSGQARCVGSNLKGQLGNGTTTASFTPVDVTGLGVGTVSQVAAGDSHSCAVLKDGTVRCWGSNQYGQLGDGTKIDHSTPVTVTGITGALYVVAGWRHTCVLLADNVKCWGIGGAVGDGTTVDRLNPTPVAW